MQQQNILDKVKHAITNNSTVKGLTRDLQNAGIKAKNELEAVILAEDYWIKINDLERGPLKNYKVSELKELPATTVRNNGIEYRIHGIVHNGSEIKLSKKTTGFIKEAVSRFSNPEEKEDYLCEPGLGRDLGLKNTKEIERKGLFPYLIKTYCRLLFNIRRAQKIKGIAEELCHQINKNYYTRVVEMINKTNENISYLPLLREIYKRREFPMPLEIEKEGLKRAMCVAISDKFRDRLLHCYLTPAISKEYAKFIKKLAVKNNLKTLHFITGLTHEPEIAHYLQSNL